MENQKLKEFFDYMSSRDYFIGNDLWAKYKELMEGDIEKKLDPTQYRGRAYENSEYSFEVVNILKDNSEPYENSVDIIITRKRDKATEHIDNEVWLFDFLDDKHEEPSDLLNLSGGRFLKRIIKDLLKVGWLKRD